MTKGNDNKKLAIQMLIAMIAGIFAGLIFMGIREKLGADNSTWQMIHSLLFQDITAAGGERSVGLFYIGGQLFIRSLQLIIVPMVFTSVVMAINEISEAATLGRVAGKTIGWFMLTSTIALVLAGTVGLLFESAGVFDVTIEGIAASTGSTGSNHLGVILNIVPSNIGSTFSVNNAVLGVVFVAVVVGLGMNQLGYDKESVIFRSARKSARSSRCS